MFQPLQSHLQETLNVHLLYIHCLCLLLCYISYIVKVKVNYEPPEESPVRVETYVGVEE
jgi:hypothetical protein